MVLRTETELRPVLAVYVVAAMQQLGFSPEKCAEIKDAIMDGEVPNIPTAQRILEALHTIGNRWDGEGRIPPVVLQELVSTPTEVIQALQTVGPLIQPISGFEAV